MIKFLGSAGSAIGCGRLTSFFPFSTGNLRGCSILYFCVWIMNTTLYILFVSVVACLTAAENWKSSTYLPLWYQNLTLTACSVLLSSVPAQHTCLTLFLFLLKLSEIHYNLWRTVSRALVSVPGSTDAQVLDTKWQIIHTQHRPLLCIKPPLEYT